MIFTTYPQNIALYYLIDIGIHSETIFFILLNMKIMERHMINQPPHWLINLLALSSSWNAFHPLSYNSMINLNACLCVFIHVKNTSRSNHPYLYITHMISKVSTIMPTIPISMHILQFNNIQNIGINGNETIFINIYFASNTYVQINIHKSDL